MILGEDLLRSALESEGFFIKLIINETAANFFPATIEHRNATIEGLQYLDDSMGNALAGTIKPNQIDVRYHKAFSDERVCANFELMFMMLDLDRADSFSVYYQGRLLIDRNQ